MTNQLQESLVKAVTKRFKDDLTVNENMISFIKDYICKNAHEYLDIQVDATVVRTDDVMGIIFDNRVCINIFPKQKDDHVEIIYKEHMSSEDMFNRRKYGDVRMRELPTPAIGPRPC